MLNGMTMVMALIVTATLLACRPLGAAQEPRCELLAGEDQFLRTLDFGPMDREALYAWISSTFAVQESAIRGSRISGEPRSIIAADWDMDGNEYSATIDEAGLESVEIWFETSSPNVQEVIDCFGPPVHYRATYLQVTHTNDLYFELWYPDQGIVARVMEAASLLQEEAPRINGRSALSTITFTRSHDPEEIATIAPIIRRHSLEAYPLKPWPGSFEAIEIEIDPAILER